MHRCKISSLNSATFLFLTAFLLFACWPGLNGPFLLDDFHNLSPYLHVQNLQQLFWVNLDLISGGDSRWLSRFSLGVNMLLSGPSPFAFKIINVLIHLVNGLMIYTLLLRILQKKGIKGQQIAILAMAIWLLHPLQVSSVLYVVQRMTLLSAFFVLLSLHFYLSLRHATLRRQQILFFFMFLLSQALGLVSKENAALVPAYALLLEYLVFKLKFEPGQVFLKKSVCTYYLIAFAAGLVLLYLVFPDFIKTYQVREFNLKERLMTEVDVMYLYFKLIFWPHVASMSLYHDDFPVRHAISLFWSLKATGLVAIWMMALKLNRIIGFAIFWFFVSHLIESTIVPLELVFEHRNYLALLGPALLVAIAIDSIKLPQKWWLGTGIVLILVILLFFRSLQWSDEKKLLKSEVDNHPDSVRARLELAGFENRQGNNFEAMKLVSSVRAGSRESGSLDIVALSYSCNRIAVQPAAIGNIRDRLAAEKITAFTLNSLSILIHNIAKGTCKSVTVGDLVQLVSGLTENHTKSHDHYAAQVDLLAARIQAIAGLGETTIDKYLSVYTRYSQFDAAMKELLQKLIMNQQIQQACDVYSRYLQARVSKQWVTGILYHDIRKQLERHADCAVM